MENIFNELKQHFKRVVPCKHEHWKTVVIYDKVFDAKTGTNYLRGKPTKTAIDYCLDCNRILRYYEVHDRKVSFSTITEIHDFILRTGYNVYRRSPLLDFNGKRDLVTGFIKDSYATQY